MLSLCSKPTGDGLRTKKKRAVGKSSTDTVRPRESADSAAFALAGPKTSRRIEIGGLDASSQTPIRSQTPTDSGQPVQSRDLRAPLPFLDPPSIFRGACIDLSGACVIISHSTINMMSTPTTPLSLLLLGAAALLLLAANTSMAFLVPSSIPIRSSGAPRRSTSVIQMAAAGQQQPSDEELVKVFGRLADKVIKRIETGTILTGRCH